MVFSSFSRGLFSKPKGVGVRIWGGKFLGQRFPKPKTLGPGFPPSVWWGKNGFSGGRGGVPRPQYLVPVSSEPGGELVPFGGKNRGHPLFLCGNRFFPNYFGRCFRVPQNKMGGATYPMGGRKQPSGCCARRGVRRPLKKKKGARGGEAPR